MLWEKEVRWIELVENNVKEPGKQKNFGIALMIILRTEKINLNFIYLEQQMKTNKNHQPIYLEKNIHCIYNFELYKTLYM